MTIDRALLTEIANRLDAAPYGRAGDIAEEYCAAMGWSATTFWRYARKGGYRKERKARSDKGAIRKMGADTIRKAAAVIEKTRRKTGKVNMTTWGLLDRFQENGIISPEERPHESTLNRHLREMGISRRDLARPEPAWPQRSLYPNHIHLIDASVCVLWDFKDQKKLATRNMQTEFYKNKPGFWRKVKKVILRYICVDHCTGWFFVWYYYAKGEDFNNLFDFTMRAWGVKENRDLFPAHGVPAMLMLDKGAANTSAAYTNLMENLHVPVYVHTPGKPWISGTVETAHGWWEKIFEGDLSLLSIANVDELNALALDRCQYVNAVRPHTRHGMTRFEAFSRIDAKRHLRNCPTVEVCRKLAHSHAEPATVDGYKQIRYDNRFYLLKGEFRRGDKVYVRFNPDDFPALEINTAIDERGRFSGDAVASTIIHKDEWGFRSNAAIIGQEYKSHEWDKTKRFKKEIKDIDISDVVPQLQAPKIEHLRWMPKEGKDLIETPEVKVPPMTAHEARKQLRQDLKIERFTVIQSQWIDRKLVETVTEEQYAAIRDEYAARFLPRETTPAAAPGLAVVNEGR